MRSGAGVAAAVELLGPGSLAQVMAVACETVAHAQGLVHVGGLLEDTATEVRELLAGFAAPGADAALGPAYAAALAGRHDSGSFYTPPALVDWVLDRALEPLLEEALEQSGPTPRVLDPACGAGAFLVPALRRLSKRLSVPVADVLADGRVSGVDLDPVAVAICRFLLWLEAPDVDRAVLERAVRVGDGLVPLEGPAYDVVVGNPPFLGQLRTRTAALTAARPRAGLGPYTDTSAVFLHHALDLVRPGGRVALVQPMSLLAARDAAPVRAAVVAAGAVTDFWSSVEPVFEGTTVRTCAPVIELGREQGAVATWEGRSCSRGGDVTLRHPIQEWGALAGASLGIPPVVLRADTGVLGDLGAVTADFRDQYYGLVPFVREAYGGEVGGSEAPLVTSGLIDPAVCRWGAATTRFAKQRYAAPVVDLVALHADGALSAWARARLVPKLLVATQGRVIEAVVDEKGAWLPSVPVLTFTSDPDRLWHALAVLLSPPVVAHAAARYAGTALAPTAIKLSAKQVAGLPLPIDRAAWDAGATLAHEAQLASSDHARGAHLRACAEVMCTAYDDDSALVWWLDRAGLGSPTSS